MQNTLSKLGFGARHKVANKRSIVDLYPSHRTGIYVLTFTNGECYAGQALDVTRRYTQHCQTYDDIRSMRFMPTSESDLDCLERETISRLEQCGARLRNVLLASITYRQTAFDAMVPPSAQESWLTGRMALDDVPYERRDVSDDDRRRYAVRFKKLMSYGIFVDECLAVLRAYMQVAIPMPCRTERAYWACSCLPKGGPDSLLYSRINIFQQEVLTTGIHKHTVAPFFSFHLAQSRFGPLQVARQRLGGHRLQWFSFSYPSGGHDQCTVMAFDAASALHLLRLPRALSAIRLFNMQLMRKGKCLNYKSHCVNLADQLLQSKRPARQRAARPKRYPSRRSR